MKKICMKSVFLLAVSLLVGCQSLTTAPGGSGYSAESYAAKHWREFANQNKKLNTVLKGLSAGESAAAYAKYIEIMSKYAPALLSEYSEIDRAFNWEEGTYCKLTFFGDIYCKPELKNNEHECTSWAVLPPFAGENQLFLHKNRDSGLRNRNIVAVHRAPAGKFSYIGIGDYGRLEPNMGINSVGLAVVMNSGDPSDGSNLVGLGTIQIAAVMLEDCSTADEAFELLKKIVEDNAYAHGKRGSMWMIADKDCVYLVEHDAKRFAYRKYDNGFVIRGNAWQLPEIVAYSQYATPVVADILNREVTIRNFLFQKGEKSYTPVTAELMTASSRITKELAADGAPCCVDTTNSGATFAIDREFPADLSTMYASFAQVDYTISIPVPQTVNGFADELFDCRFSAPAFKEYVDGKRSFTDEERSKLENAMYQNHNNARAKARALLRADYSEKSRLEARRIMNGAFEKNWQLVKDFIGN